MGNRVLLKDLQPGTLYYLQFRAKNEAMGMYSQWSNIFELLTIHDVIPPMAVENLVWEPRGTSFYASWDAPQYSEDGTPALDLAGYEITLYAPADGVVVGLPAPDPNKKVVYKTISPNFNFTFEDNVAAFDYPRGKVAIEVRAFDITGNLSAPTFATAQNPLPAEVPAFDATGMMDAISFDWTKNAAPPDNDIKFYRIRQGATSGTVNTIIAEVNDVHTEWATINTAIQYFSITAVDVFYQESATRKTDSAAARSSLEVDVTPPGAPTSVATTSGIDPSDPSNSRVYIDVTWVKPNNTDLQEYIIRYSPTGTNWQYLKVPAEDTTGAAVQTARIFGLVAGQSYYVAVQVSDFTANVSAWVNSATYPQTTPKDTTGPAAPAAPTVAVNVGGTQIQVSHNLKDSGGTNNLATDLHHLEVYASTTSGFTPATANKVGDMEVVPPPASGPPVTAIQNFTVIPTGGSTTQTWYVKVIAVDNNGNKSAASPENSGNVPLMSAVAIADATITSAKISDLQANKITAGTGLINDITVKSKLTMGDGSTNGIIESFDYVGGGTTGWRIEKGAFTVNAGQINARALRLQDGSENLMHPAYADFEWAPTWYTGKLTSGNGSTLSIDGTQFRYNAQSLKLVAGATASAVAYLAPAANAYNINVDGGQPYIISCYAYQNTGSAITVALLARESNLDNFMGGATNFSLPSGVWTRISAVVTPNAASTKMLVYVTSVTTNVTVYFDGFQVEKQISGTTTPSQWTPPSTTFIDGGMITTGSIQSTAASDGVAGQPAWSINAQGGMQVGNANVRGTLYVGPTGSNEAASAVRSGVYAGNSTGWIIRGDGYAEFNNVLVRGNIQATSGNFLNTITVGDSASATHLVRSFNHAYSNAGWIIRGDGYAEFSNVLIRGTVYASAGEFTGTIKAGSSIESNVSMSAPIISGGSIIGATITSTTGTGQRIEIRPDLYNKILFYPNNGEDMAAEIRVGEATDIAQYAMQLYSPRYGGNIRSHISVVGATGGNASEIDLVAPSGNIYASGAAFNMNGGDIRSSHAVVAGNGTYGTERIAIGSYSGNEGFVQGRGTAATGIRLGGTADYKVRIVDSSGAGYTNLHANSLYVEGNVSYQTVTNRSDVRLKTNIEPIDFGIDVVRQAPARAWKWKMGASKDYVARGLLTEDLPRELVVMTEAPGHPADDVGHGEEVEGVDLYALIGVMWNALRELDVELDDLRSMTKRAIPSRKIS